METSIEPKKSHLGRKVSRLRELRGMKQETLAAGLGITQQAISRLENSEDIEDSTLEKIAQVLGVTPEAIKVFSEDAVFNNIQNNSDTTTGNTIVNYQFHFNALEKVIELYERLLVSEREKNEILKEKK